MLLLLLLLLLLCCKRASAAMFMLPGMLTAWCAPSKVDVPAG
jgi:hypothetical protein